MVQVSNLPTPAGVVGDTYSPSSCLIFVQLFRRFQVKWSGNQGSRVGVQQFVSVGTWAQAWLLLFRDGGMDWNMNLCLKDHIRRAVCRLHFYQSCLRLLFLPIIVWKCGCGVRVNTFRPEQKCSEQRDHRRSGWADGGAFIAPYLSHGGKWKSQRLHGGRSKLCLTPRLLFKVDVSGRDVERKWREPERRCLSDQKRTNMNGLYVQFEDGITAAQQLFFQSAGPPSSAKTYLDSVFTPSLQIKSFLAYKKESTTTSRAICNIHCSLIIDLFAHDSA